MYAREVHKILDHAHVIISHAHCLVSCKLHVQQVRSKKIVAKVARLCNHNRRGWHKENLLIASVVNCQKLSFKIVQWD